MYKHLITFSYTYEHWDFPFQKQYKTSVQIQTGVVVWTVVLVGVESLKKQEWHMPVKFIVSALLLYLIAGNFISFIIWHNTKEKEEEDNATV